MGRDWRLGEWRVEVICGQLVTSGHAFGMVNPIGFFLLLVCNKYTFLPFFSSWLLSY